MALYTFFFEFRNGTYISQIRARNYLEAPRIWAEELDLPSIPNANEILRSKLTESLAFDKPVRLQGIQRTWCCSLIYVSRALLHFTQTAE